MPEINNNDDRIYNRKRPVENSVTINFMVKYQKLVDFSALKSDKDKYVRRLSSISKVVDKVNFNSNLLFISSRDIARDLFLVGFGKLKKLHSYYYCNLMQMYDIFFGNMRPDNPNLAESDIMWSEQNVTEDVLCLFIDEEMHAFNHCEKMITSFLVSRDCNARFNGRVVYNWVFYRGTISSLEQNDGLRRLLDLFKSRIAAKEAGWRILDFNKLNGEY